MTVNASTATLIDWLGRPPRDESGIFPEVRLLMLADEISRLASMETEALERLVLSELLNKRASLLTLCMERLDALPRLSVHPGTPAWSTFLEQSRDHLLSQIQSSESQPIAEALRHASSNIESLRQIGADFAEAIKAWPIICGAAAALEIPQHASNATQPDR